MYTISKKAKEIFEEMKTIQNEARVFADNGDVGKSEEKLKVFNELKKKYEIEQAIYEAEKIFNEDVKDKGIPGTTAEKNSDVVKAFASAVRNKFLFESVDSNNSYENGGYVVPEDIQTKINEYKDETFSFEDYINIEKVNTNKGARTFLTRANDFTLEEVDENGEIPEISTPTFERQTYSVRDFGGYLPVSKDLLADSDTNIVEQISKWFVKAKRGTTNAEILDLINAKTSIKINSIDDIIDIVLIALGGSYRGSSKIFTNDDGVAYLAKLKDENGRALLNPIPSEPMKMQFSCGPIVLEIVQVPNKVLITKKVESGEGQTITIEYKIPFIVGDLKTAFTKFDRQIATISTSDIASTNKYNAFTQNLILYKIFQRMDFKTIDNNAFVNAYISTNR